MSVKQWTYSPRPSGHDEQESFLGRPLSKARTPLTQSLRSVYFTTLHILVVVLLGINAFSWRWQAPRLLPSELPFARGFIEYEEVIFAPSGFNKDGKPATLYEGEPNAINEALWHNLTKVGMYAVNVDEYSQLKVGSAEIPWMPNHHIVTIEVFHQLHCLNYLRRRVYEKDGEHFWPDESDWSRKGHLSHCIDYLRQVLMCNADLTPITLELGSERFEPNFAIKHTCRKWDRIWDFALQGNISGTSVEG